MPESKVISTKIHKIRRDHDPKADLRSPGLLAKWPLIGIIMFIFGGLMFTGLTINLFFDGPLLAWDNTLANGLPAIGLRSPAPIKEIMIAGFIIGREGIIILVVVLGIYFIYKRFWQELVMIAIGVGGGELLFFWLSNLIARPRPATQIWNILNIPGFPSGHGLSAITFFGFLAYLLIPRMPSALWKWVVAAVALLIIIYIGFSRVFTGGHYLTDVLSGYALGIAWSGAVYTLIEIYFASHHRTA